MKKILLLLSAGTFVLYPQDTLKYSLEPVVVEAARPAKDIYNLPYSTYLINAEEMLPNSGRTIKDLLQFQPGVFVLDRNNPSLGDKIIMRGVGSRSSFGIRGIKILLDNIPLTFPDGQAQMNNLDLNSIGEVEIISGSSSSLYGNAAGGVMNIRTKNFGDKLIVIPSFKSGSGNLYQYDLIINYKNLFLDFTKLNYDGWREHSSANYYHLNSIYSDNISSAFSFSVLFNFYSAPYLLSPGSLSEQDAENIPESSRFINKKYASGKEVSQWQTGTTFKYKTDSGIFENTLYFIRRETLNSIFGRIIDLKRNSYGLRSVYNSNFNPDINFTAGFDLEFQDDKRIENESNGVPDNLVNSLRDSKFFDNLQYGGLIINQKEKVLSFGPFAQMQYNIISGISLTAGIRYDHYKFNADDFLLSDGVNNSGERKMESINPLIGLNYRITNLSKVFLNYSTSFQTPTTNELSNSQNNAGGFNPDLNPEYLKSVEAGYQQYISALDLLLHTSAYRISFDDLIIPFQLSGDQTFYRNAAEAVNYGIEIKAEYTSHYNFRLKGSYTFNNFRFGDYVLDGNNLEGNFVPGVPQNSYAAAVSYFFYNVQLEIDITGNDPYFVDDLNLAVNPGYTIFNLKTVFEKQLSSFLIKLFGGVSNIFDLRYNSSITPNAAGERYFESGQGRNWYAGVHVNFGGN